MGGKGLSGRTQNTQVNLPGHKGGPTLHDPNEIRAVRDVWRAHGVMQLSITHIHLQTRRALPANLAAVEFLVVIVGPRRPQAVSLRHRMAQTNHIHDLLVLDASVCEQTDVPADLRAQRAHEDHVGVQQGNDRVGRDGGNGVFEPVLHPPRLVVEVI